MSGLIDQGFKTQTDFYVSHKLLTFITCGCAV